jgi:diacylglycerol kinase family enzyme
MPKKVYSHRPLRAKLIFNAISGHPEESPHQLADILNELQSRNILPEVSMVRPDSQVEAVVRSAIRRGIKLIVVAGGDGTIDSVAGAMVGSSATLGIIPIGTRNNVAFNLGIPTTIAAAVALLRDGRRQKIDVGHMRSGRASRWFLEAATLGLLSDLFPVADNIQHGNLAQIGELLSTFFSATPSTVRMVLDNHKHLDVTSHMVLIANMPFLGPHFQISSNVSFMDSHLDVFVFSDMSKLNLISYVMQAIAGPVENPSFRHYRVRHLKIDSTPQMLVLGDGIQLGQGSVTALVHARSLGVMVGAADATDGKPTAPPAIDREVLYHG